ncbi:MAG TPA: mechanosensitive ion channel domain-containing protein [Salinimicrobium sp.]|nr:mechanosensitive ion channel domain-containing protein [Salinimicrobium sp.]
MIQPTETVSYLENYFLESGMSKETAHFLDLGISTLVLIILLFICFFITKKIIIRAFGIFSLKTKTTFDDYLVQSNFPKYVGYILPVLLVIFAVPVIYDDYPRFLSIFGSIIDIYIVFLVVLIIRSFIRSFIKYLKTLDKLKDKPLDSFTQVIMIFVWLIAFVFIFSELTGKSVLEFLITLGAASAIILLIFKDTILGFVASIQVSVNDIVRLGDWITFDKFGADGFVTEINLATVKVQNWDKTYTTIPTYSLISDSFQNWRGMEESPGRRVKRALLIKQSSVKFLAKDELEKFKDVHLIKDYIEERQNIIDDYNKINNIKTEILVNGRKQTNLGLFRQYTEAYLKQHPMVNKEMWVIVRHLNPGIHGIPLELYFFSSDKRWAYYEVVAADIFEHLIASVSFFGLKLFEAPSGDDIIKFSETLNLPKD